MISDLFNVDEILKIQNGDKSNNPLIRTTASGEKLPKYYRTLKSSRPLMVYQSFYAKELVDTFINNTRTFMGNRIWHLETAEAGGDLSQDKGLSIMKNIVPISWSEVNQMVKFNKPVRMPIIFRPVEVGMFLQDFEEIHPILTLRRRIYKNTLGNILKISKIGKQEVKPYTKIEIQKGQRLISWRKGSRNINNNREDIVEIDKGHLIAFEKFTGVMKESRDAISLRRPDLFYAALIISSKVYSVAPSLDEVEDNLDPMHSYSHLMQLNYTNSTILKELLSVSETALNKALLVVHDEIDKRNRMMEDREYREGVAKRYGSRVALATRRIDNPHPDFLDGYNATFSRYLGMIDNSYSHTSFNNKLKAFRYE